MTKGKFLVAKWQILVAQHSIFCYIGNKELRHNLGHYNSMRSYVESSYHKLVLKSNECQEIKKEKKHQLFKVVIKLKLPHPRNNWPLFCSFHLHFMMGMTLWLTTVVLITFFGIVIINFQIVENIHEMWEPRMPSEIQTIPDFHSAIKYQALQLLLPPFVFIIVFL